MTGIVELVKVDAEDTWTGSNGKPVHVDYVTVGGVEYRYNRADFLAPLKQGDEIRFEPGKDKFGKDKMTGVKKSVGEGAPPPPSRQSSSPAPAQPAPQTVAPRITGAELRQCALENALRFMVAYKKKASEPKDVLTIADEFQYWLMKGQLKNTPSKEAVNNTAGAAPEVKTQDDDAGDDLPF